MESRGWIAIFWTYSVLTTFVFAEGPAFLDELWTAPTLISADDDPFLQQLALTGIVHYQYAVVDGEGSNFYDSDLRRFRFGAKGQLLKQFYVSGAANFRPDGDSFYRNLSTAYIAWSPHGNDKEDLSQFHIAAGKLKPRFTREYSTSAKKIKTFERSLLVNMLAPSKATGFGSVARLAMFPTRFPPFQGMMLTNSLRLKQMELCFLVKLESISRTSGMLGSIIFQPSVSKRSPRMLIMRFRSQRVIMRTIKRAAWHWSRI